jgi:hypothetical protein
MAKKIRVWDGTAWQDVAPSLPYTAIHSAQASMPATGVDGQVWLDTDGTLADTAFVPLSGGTMTGNLNTPSINNGPIVGRNKILNGDFSIWQRGSSVTAGTYTADRWVNTGGSGTVARQTFTPGTAPVAGYEGRFYLNWTITADQINNEMLQRIEDARTFSGQTVTLSFWARSTVGAQPFNVAIYQHFGTGGSPSSLTGATLISGGSPYTPTSSWQRFTFTFTVPSVSGKTFGTNNDSFLWVRPAQFTTTATNTSLDLWGIQLEAGSVATPYHNATPNQQTELAACQRYYYRTNGTTYTPLTVGGYTQSTTDLAWWVPLPVSMRVAPTSLEFSGSGAIAFRSANNGSGYTMGNLTFASSLSTPTLARGGGSISSGTWVTFHSGYLEGNNGPCYLGFSAEL